MPDELRIYFSFRSPYSRLGLHKIARAGLADMVPTRLIPFIAPASDVPFFDPMSSPPKMAYYMEDVPRMTLRMNLPIQPPNPFDVPLTRANKAFIAARAEGKGLAFALAVSDARWGKGLNISDLEVLSACAREAGLDPDLPKNAKSDKQLESELDACHEESSSDQVFGVPFAILNKSEQAQKFWGQDRFDLLAEILS